MVLRLLLAAFLSCTLSAQELNENDLEAKVRTAKAKSRLKQIGTTYAMYFTDGVTLTMPTPEQADVDPSIRTYIHPTSGKEEKFLIVQPGLKYEGSPDLLLAVTNKPIGDKYLACFEDGHVEFISKDFFQKHIIILGLKKEKKTYKKVPGELQREIDLLIQQLGAKKYKERKAAKEKLLAKGSDILGYLEQVKNHDDFEVKVSISEIMKELDSKVPAPLGKRPRLDE